MDEVILKPIEWSEIPVELEVPTIRPWTLHFTFLYFSSSTGWKIFGKSLIYLKNFKPVGAFNNEMKHICIQISDAQAKKKEK